MAVSKNTWTWVYIHEDLVKWAIWIAFGLLIAMPVGSGFLRLFPAEMSMTTTETIPYLPASYQLVDKVENKFVQSQGFGGAGGIGAPQVEVSISQYKEQERPAVHYLTLSGDNGKDILQYWDPQPGRLVHASIKFDAPIYEQFGIPVGWFNATRGSVDGNQLTIERRYVPFGGSGGLIFLATVLALILWASVSWVTSHNIIETAYGRRY